MGAPGPVRGFAGVSYEEAMRHARALIPFLREQVSVSEPI